MITTVKSINKRTVRRVLERARQIIAQPFSWRKDASAGRRNELGDLVASVSYSDPNANCWCATGAVALAAREMVSDDGAVPRSYVSSKLEQRALLVLAQNLSKKADFEFGSVVGFNDDADTTHKQVLNMFDRSIKKVTL